MKLIAIDAGRYAIKAAMYQDGKILKKSIEQLYADIDIDLIRRTPIIGFKRDDIIASVNGDELQVYGGTCRKFLMPQDINYVTYDKNFVKKAIDYTLVSIANMLTNDNDKAEEDDIIISFSVTSNTVFYSDELMKALKGKHDVSFYMNNGGLVRTAKFNISNIKFVYQGHMAYLDYIIDDNFEILHDRVKDSIVFDFGRRTLDVVYTHEVGQLKNIAFNDIGIESLFESIASDFAAIGAIKQTSEIENILLSEKTIFVVDGKQYDMGKKISRRILSFVNRAITRSLDKFGGLTPDIYILTGGGSLLLGDIVKNSLDYGDKIDVMKDPVFSNACGSLKIMVRKYEKDTKKDKIS